MALFGSKKRTTKSAKPAAVEQKVSVSASSPRYDAFAPIVRPRITEKATMKQERDNCYVFDVTPGSNKISVARAIKEMFKVVPEKVRIVTVPSKTVFVRGKAGRKAGGKKAYVYLKKGDKIEIA